MEHLSTVRTVSPFPPFGHENFSGTTLHHSSGIYSDPARISIDMAPAIDKHLASTFQTEAVCSRSNGFVPAAL
ncbi:hypothetical protein [Methylobacterium sp. yr668]|uniref:hypothetical protein n=1 Tax=Methylobacterium sp. yr668 TaxID=1761801 RepID=UPI001114CD6F|nr:hypothetical protein [Methylobacterium sp. yr668]